MLAMFDQMAPNDLRRNYKLVGSTWMWTSPSSSPSTSRSRATTPTPTRSSASRPPADEVPYANITQDDERTAASSTAGVTPAQDYAANGSDSPFSLLAGEDRMSSTSMESFTQGAAAVLNCFPCHNTQARHPARHLAPTTTNSRTQPPSMTPKLINVSHVFSEFILEECGPNGACPQ